MHVLHDRLVAPGAELADCCRDHVEATAAAGNCGTHGGRMACEMPVGTALGLRSMVRMEPHTYGWEWLLPV